MEEDGAELLRGVGRLETDADLPFPNQVFLLPSSPLSFEAMLALDGIQAPREKALEVLAFLSVFSGPPVDLFLRPDSPTGSSCSPSIKTSAFSSGDPSSASGFGSAVASSSFFLAASPKIPPR